MAENGYPLPQSAEQPDLAAFQADGYIDDNHDPTLVEIEFGADGIVSVTGGVWMTRQELLASTLDSDVEDQLVAPNITLIRGFHTLGDTKDPSKPLLILSRRAYDKFLSQVRKADPEAV